MKHFVGLDVFMKETAVCVVDGAGQRVWEGSVPSSANAIAAIMREKAPDLVRAGMESGPQAVWLWHALRDMGIAVDCNRVSVCCVSPGRLCQGGVCVTGADWVSGNSSSCVVVILRGMGQPPNLVFRVRCCVIA